LFLEHNAGFNNIETVQMSCKGKDLSHIASEITSEGKMECIASKKRYMIRRQTNPGPRRKRLNQATQPDPSPG
jgi:hypothetical protein